MDNQQPKEKKKMGFLAKAGIVLGILIVLGIIGSLASPSSNSNSNSSASKTNGSVSTAYGPNQDVRVGDVRWKLLSARDRGNTLKASESRYASITNSKTVAGKYIEITMEVENLGTELKSVGSLKLIDDRNREFTIATDVSEWIPEGKDIYILDNLNPNVPRQFTALYEVPADAKGIRVMVGDLELFGSKEAQIRTEI